MLKESPLLWLGTVFALFWKNRVRSFVTNDIRVDPDPDIGVCSVWLRKDVSVMAILNIN